MHEPLSATLDAFIAKGVVGACAAVMTRGAPPIVVARGLADRERRIPFATESLTKIGSCTKTFVAATLLRLIADGLVSPDVAVSTWFPNLPKSDRISVRQLVNHRSGLPEFEFDMPVAPGRTWTPQQIVDLSFCRPTAERAGPRLRVQQHGLRPCRDAHRSADKRHARRPDPETCSRPARPR
jgi:D-alanyl-D-alanine carboxypeptidase